MLFVVWIFLINNKNISTKLSLFDIIVWTLKKGIDRTKLGIANTNNANLKQKY